MHWLEIRGTFEVERDASGRVAQSAGPAVTANKANTGELIANRSSHTSQLFDTRHRT